MGLPKAVTSIESGRGRYKARRVFRAPPRSDSWTLWNTETLEFVEDGFPVEGEIVEAFGSEWSTFSGLGQSVPIQQWVAGIQRTLTFEAFFFARTQDDSILGIIAQLKKWAMIDRSLKPPRQPRLMFDYGEAFQVPCVLDQVGALRWEGALRGDGTPRLARVSLILRYWEDDIAFEETDPSRPETSTVYHEVAKGETFEHVAAKRYGTENALFGVLLRQDNPDKNALVVGDTIAIPDPDKIGSRIIEPTAPIFGDDQDAADALSEYVDLRSTAGSRIPPPVTEDDPGFASIPLAFSTA